MEIKIIKPSEKLAPFIKHFWFLESHLNAEEICFQRIIPNGFADLIFYFDDIPEYYKKEKKIRASALINGQQDEFYDIKIMGKMSLISVIFRPNATRLFFDIPSYEFYNQTIDAELIFKNEIINIREQISQKETFSERIKILENFLIKKLEKNYSEEIFRINNSILKISDKTQNYSIEELSSSSYLSLKQYERKFNDFVGISPKKFQRIIRLQKAIHEMQINNDKNLTEIAYKSGFFDQSHMIYDFKALTGLTPKQFLNECEPFSDYFG